MRQADKSEFYKFTELADAQEFGRVYVRAVVNGRQSGEIFTDGRSVLVWHRCGFAWLLGGYVERFLDGIDRLRTEGGSRLVLFSDDEKVWIFFERRGASSGRRLYFEYRGAGAEAVLPEGYSAREIDGELFGRLESRVVPKLFWRDAEEFSRSGRGFCIMSGDEPAAWAFTASCDGEEADIGVETAVEHRGKGLAFAAAAMTLNAVLRDGMKAVWACDGGNSASQGLARKLGFECVKECWAVK